MTEAELALEPVIASLGRVYRAQHPFFDMGIFSDFVLMQDKVIIEVDGPSHRRPAQQEKDAARDAALAKRGWRTVRVSNEWALRATREELVAVLGLGSAGPTSPS